MNMALGATLLGDRGNAAGMLQGLVIGEAFALGAQGGQQPGGQCGAGSRQ